MLVFKGASPGQENSRPYAADDYRVPTRMATMYNGGAPFAPEGLMENLEGNNSPPPVHGGLRQIAAQESHDVEAATGPPTASYGTPLHEANGEQTDTAQTDTGKPEDAMVLKPTTINVLSIYHKDLFVPRREQIRKQALLSLGLSASLILSLSFFLGSTWNPNQYASNIGVAVVDFDGTVAPLGIYGNMQLVIASGKLPVAFRYNFISAVSTSPTDINNRVNNGEFYAALYVNSGAVNAMLASLTNSSIPYDPTGAMTLTYDQGRGGPNIASLLNIYLPAIVAATNNICAQVLMASGVAGQFNFTSPTVNPNVIITPVGYRLNNLHPVLYPGLNTLLGLCFTIIWMMCLVTVNAVLGFTENLSEKGARPDHILVLQFLLAFLTFGVLALWPISIAIAFGATVSSSLQYAQFWAFTWFSMSTFGSCIGWMMYVFGPTYGNAAHGIFFMLNFFSSSGIIHPDLEYPFFQMGQGLPMRQGLEGLRTILLGSYNRLTVNCAVLGAYLGFNVLCFLVWTLVLARRVRAEHERRAAIEVNAGRSMKFESAPLFPTSLDGSMVWNTSMAVALSASSKAVGSAAG